MRYAIGMLFSAILFVSCTQKPKEKVEPITVMASPAGAHSALPFLYTNKAKTLLSWVEKVGDSLSALKYAELTNDAWQQPQTILQASDWFVNWADFPAIAEQNGNLLSHVLKKSSAGTYSYDVKLNLRQAGATQWNTNLPLHTDGTPTEHGFVSALPYKEGFFITWLDGRNTMEDEHGNRGAMTIRAAEVSPSGEIQNEAELDHRACDCCQTTAAITTNGPVVIYRDRSDTEVRDMSIVRWENGSWTAPKTVYPDRWQIKGCPVNGPKAAALEHVLVVAWFSAANEKPKVQLAFSEDDGANFNEPVLIGDTKAIGRVDVLLLDKETAIVSWMEAEGKKAQLKAVKVARNGSQGTPHVIVAMNASRQSGFPQMERVGDTVYFAWTEVGDGTSEVKTAFVPTAYF